MSQDPRVQDERNFIETCLELKLLEDTEAESLSEAIGHGSGVVQTVLRRGMLTAADVDIVQSLQHPTEIVPGYKIQQLIGRGAMGVVYRAEQLDLEKTVALKTILISNVHDPTVAARFEREAKSLAQLQHPNIVQALNFGRHEGRYYFAMEFVPGRTCEQSVREAGLLAPEKVWSIVRQTASGLMHAFGHNLIHRDIKPANLILLPPPEGSVSTTEIVKIADFGLAMFTDPSSEQLKLTTGDKAMGSPAYMSLEQFGGRPVDFRSDMYSLGATAWHLLFGNPAFRGSSVAALFQQKSQPLSIDPSTLTVKLPDDQMQLLTGLLAPDPNLRPSSYQQLIESIDGLGISGSDQTTDLRSNQFSNTLPPIATGDQPTIVFSPPHLEDDSAKPDVTVSPASNDAGNTSLPTSNQAASLGSTKWYFNRWLMTACVCATVSALIGLAFLKSNPSGPRIYTQVIGNTPLFDGVTLAGWDVGGSMIGAWNSVEAPDSSTAIACTTRRGALTRRIPETSHPRISLFVWLQPNCGAVDIDFAFDHNNPSDTRGCLRLSGAKNQFGKKSSDFGDLTINSESDAIPTVFDRYHVVHIERQPKDWYVFLEEKLIGTLPTEAIGTGDAIRLVVHGHESGETEQSEAYFADVQLYELQERRVTP